MDDKRFIRQLKKQIKTDGNRKLRRFLKNPQADPDEFEYGSSESSTLNGRNGKNTKRKNHEPDNNGSC